QLTQRRGPSDLHPPIDHRAGAATAPLRRRRCEAAPGSNIRADRARGLRTGTPRTTLGGPEFDAPIGTDTTRPRYRADRRDAPLAHHGTSEPIRQTGVHESGRTALRNAGWREPRRGNVLAFMRAVE